jgi:hypothetical protein
MLENLETLISRCEEELHKFFNEEEKTRLGYEFEK